MRLRITAGPGGVQVEHDGRLQAVPPGSRALFGETARGRDEGRYLAVAMHDGRCEVSADRFGQVDLYYRDTTDGGEAATDLDLLLGESRPAAMDQGALAHAFCVYGNRPPKRHTIYQGVRRLGVGETLSLGRAPAGTRTGPFTPAPAADYTDADLHRYADALIEAVRSRASDNGNIIYLSSGWDSTALLGCLVHLFGPGKVHAIVGRMQYAERSGVINQFEIDRAQAVADYYGVSLEIAEFDYRHDGPEQLNAVLPLFKRHNLASLTGLNHALLAEAARKSGRGDTIFAGEISDGAHNLGFSQYVTIFHPVLDFREYSDKMASYLFGPTFLGLLREGRHAADPVYGLLRGRCGDAAFDDLAEPDGRTLQLLSSFFLRGGRMPLWSLRNSRFLTSAGAREYAREMEQAYLAGPAREVTQETLYAWYLRLYNSFHWQGSTVATLPLTAEAQGLTAAMPFWDGAIQDFLSAMPEHFGRGLDFNRTKYPLKWTLQHRIKYPYHLQAGPHSYLYDVDHSFSHAAELLYASSFAPMFRRQLAAHDYRDRLAPDWFDREYIDRLVAEYAAGRIATGSELSDLTSLCLMTMAGWY